MFGLVHHNQSKKSGGQDNAISGGPLIIILSFRGVSTSVPAWAGTPGNPPLVLTGQADLSPGSPSEQRACARISPSNRNLSPSK